MDDVLPKPFTRKSLLDMLERHLVHLKSVPPAIEAPPTSTMPIAAQASTAHSVKEDSSSAPSPAASINNWQSPGQFNGVPTAVNPNLPQIQGQYIPATPGAAAYAVDQSGVQYPAPPVPLATPATRPQNRRQVSEMSSAAENRNLAKRPRVYAQPQPMVNPVQATRTV